MAVLAERERFVVVGVDCTPALVALLSWPARQAELIGVTLVAVTGWRIDLPEFRFASTVIEVEARTRQVLVEAIRTALPPGASARGAASSAGHRTCGRARR